MPDRLKEIISKSEHLAELFAEREGAAIFSQVGTNPKENFFFLKRARIRRNWVVFKAFTFS